MAAATRFEDSYPYGTTEDQKGSVRLLVDRIELDPDRRVGEVYMRRFPMPASGTGKYVGMVAGARYTHQKRNFPPIDVMDIQFEYQGRMRSR